MAYVQEPGYPEPYYAQGWEPPPPRLEPTSVWALVTGLLGFGPVAIVLSIVALRLTAKRGTRGRGLAVAGGVLGIVWTLVGVAVVTTMVLSALQQRPLPADVPQARDAHAQALVTGNCVAELPDDGPVDTVRVVPCATEHEAQVVTSYAFGDDAQWPGQSRADLLVAQACVLDDDEVAAGIRTVTWAPTEESWRVGDRTGLCLAVLDDGGLTGSLLDDSAVLP